MTLVLIDTPLRKHLRGGVSPNSAKYDSKQLDAYKNKAGSLSAEDNALYESAKWIFQESSFFRMGFEFVDRDLAALGGKVSTLLAIASLNREYMVAQKLGKIARQQAVNRGAVALDHIFSEPIQSGHEGQKLPLNALTEASVDACESWVFDASRLFDINISIPEEISYIAVNALRKYSMQRGLNVFWNDALYAGGHIAIRNKKQCGFPCRETFQKNDRLG